MTSTNSMTTSTSASSSAASSYGHSYGSYNGSDGSSSASSYSSSSSSRSTVSATQKLRDSDLSGSELAYLSASMTGGRRPTVVGLRATTKGAGVALSRSTSSSSLSSSGSDESVGSASSVSARGARGCKANGGDLFLFGVTALAWAAVVAGGLTAGFLLGWAHGLTVVCLGLAGLFLAVAVALTLLRRIFPNCH